MRLPNQSKPIFRGASTAAILGEGIAVSGLPCQVLCAAAYVACAAGCGWNPICHVNCGIALATCLANC